MDEEPWEVLRRLPPGTRVELEDAEGRRHRGTLVPRHDLSGDRIVQLKLDSGYNVGVRIGPTSQVHRLAEREFEEASEPAARPRELSANARTDAAVHLLSTGGTIASRIDYATGGVRPVRTEEEILAFYPEIDREGPVRVASVFDRLSEDLTPGDWVEIARRAAASFSAGARGVVIAHGTDTLAMTAAALCFLLEDLPGPVVLVGAQRSPDRPSSDGASNLEAAVALARSADLGEVVVLMHAGLSDDRFAIHRGTRVRKMHSSRRDAFATRNGPPLGTIESGAIHLRPEARPRSAGPVRLDERIDLRAGLLYSYPGLEPDRARAFAAGLRGVILAGTGLGHVASTHLPWIRAAADSGTLVAMTTQCLEGNADPYVYSTGRELLRAGVLYLEDLLPETAYAKLVWALGQSDSEEEVRRLLLEDRAGEFGRRHLLEAPA